jgi:hypothetical protein
MLLFHHPHTHGEIINSEEFNLTRFQLMCVDIVLMFLMGIY